MTETEHLIRQAAYEIGVNKHRSNPITIITNDGTSEVRFRNRHGDMVSLEVKCGQTFKEIHAAVRAAYRALVRQMRADGEVTE